MRLSENGLRMKFVGSDTPIVSEVVNIRIFALIQVDICVILQIGIVFVTLLPMLTWSAMVPQDLILDQARCGKSTEVCVTYGLTAVGLNRLNQ